MTQNLVKYLEFAETGDKAILDTLPRELGVSVDGNVQSVKELLASSAIEGTKLIQSEVVKTVMEGANFAATARQAIPTIQMKSNTLNWTIGETGTIAETVAEGAEIPIATQDYSTVEFKVSKYATRPLITQELVDDSLFSIVELELRNAGRKIENALNQVAITEMIDNTSLEHDTAASDVGIKALAVAVSKVRNAGYSPDSVIIHPEFEAEILKEFTPSNYYPAESIVKTGMVPNVLGLKVYTNGVTSNGTETWGYDTDGDIGAVVFDSSCAAFIGERKGITVNQYSDPIRDLVGLSVLSRFDVKTVQANASCRIEY